MLLLLVLIILGTCGLVWFGASHDASTLAELISVYEKNYQTQMELASVAIFIVAVAIPFAFSIFLKLRESKPKNRIRQ